MGAIKRKYGPNFLGTEQLGAANGVAGLGPDQKLLSQYLPAGVGAGFNRKGNFDASGGTYPASPADGDFYVVSVTGTVSGQKLTVGDSIYYTAATTSWNVIDQSRSTDELPEGANLYFTDARARTAAVQNSLAASTTIAPSASAVAAALAQKANLATRFKESIVLSSTDATNGYVTLAHAALPFTINANVRGGIAMEESLDGTAGDYGVSIDPISQNTRLTFKNDLASAGATPLIAGDAIFVQYSY